MEQSKAVKFVKPPGFDELYEDVLADCVARGIVERAIKNLHMRKSAEAVEGQEVDSGSEKPA